MAFDVYIKVKDIPGGATQIKDAISVHSFSWSAHQPTTAAGTFEKANFQDFSIVKTLDKSSPKLAEALSTGKKITEVILEIYSAEGEKSEKFMEYKLEECRVSSISMGGGGGGEVMETVSFSYGKITWTYKEKAGGQVAASFDLLKTNK